MLGDAGDAWIGGMKKKGKKETNDNSQTKFCRPWMDENDELERGGGEGYFCRFVVSILIPHQNADCFAHWPPNFRYRQRGEQTIALYLSLSISL